MPPPCVEPSIHIVGACFGRWGGVAAAWSTRTDPPTRDGEATPAEGDGSPLAPPRCARAGRLSASGVQRMRRAREGGGGERKLSSTMRLMASDGWSSWAADLPIIAAILRRRWSFPLGHVPAAHVLLKVAVSAAILAYSRGCGIGKRVVVASWETLLFPTCTVVVPWSAFLFFFLFIYNYSLQGCIKTYPYKKKYSTTNKKRQILYAPILLR